MARYHNNDESNLAIVVLVDYRVRNLFLQDEGYVYGLWDASGEALKARKLDRKSLGIIVSRPTLKINYIKC
jgi:hypothetical protein